MFHDGAVLGYNPIQRHTIRVRSPASFLGEKMQEPKITVIGNKMTIEIDLDEKGSPSKSGKTNVISSTHGNRTINTDSGDVVVGLNVYRRI
jgi:hypothetical protein